LNNFLRRLLNVVLLNVFISFAPGISMAAHFGGGAAGVAAGILLHGNRHGTGIVKILATIGLVLFPLACFAALFLGLKANPEWDALEYEYRREPKMVAAEVAANKIIDSTLQPLWERPLQRLSEQELRDAIQAQQEAVKALREGAQIGNEQPTYRDSKVESVRQANVLRFEHNIAVVEGHTWLLVSPAARDEMRQAMRVFRQKAQPLLRMMPATRPKEILEDAQAALQEQVGKLAGMRELLQLMGPLESKPGLEEARQKEIEDLTFTNDLLKAAATGLNEGSSWPEDKRREYETLEAKIKS
jgi:hypothetical protein